jgi:hypothetical protein
MRYLGLVALAALAGCGSGGENETKAAAPDTIPAGQYEVTAETTQFSQADEGEAALNMAVGTREVRSVCIGDTASPDLFAAEGMTCRQGSSDYIRSGTISSTYSCTVEGREGGAALTISGTFTADGFQATRNLRTTFEGPGDVTAAANLTGRRTGDCTPGADAGNSAAPANSN